MFDSGVLVSKIWTSTSFKELVVKNVTRRNPIILLSLFLVALGLALKCVICLAFYSYPWYFVEEEVHFFSLR